MFRKNTSRKPRKKKPKKILRESQKKRKVLFFLKKRGRDSFKAPKRKDSRRIKNTPNANLIYLVILLCIGGLLMIFSASAVNAYSLHGDTFFFFKRQIIWLVLGIVGAFFFYSLPIETIRKLSVPLLLIGIFLLFIMIPEAVFKLDTPLVATRNGATRWISFGAFDLQPAEFIKFAFILYVSAWLTRDDVSKNKYTDFQSYFYSVILPFLGLLGFMSGLILTQRDLDTTVIIVLSILTIYYISGTHRLHSLSAVFIFVFSVIFGIFAILLEPYRRSRVKTFLDILIKGEPTEAQKLGDSFQSWNGIVAIGYGGFWGRGYGESRLKLGFLQEAAYTDSIFAVVGEEFGFLGAIILIVGFLYFTSLGMNIALNAKDKFSSLIAAGMTSWISIQAFLNIAANLQVIPFGGMPLPFFSYGGSSTIMILMAVGVILNVSKKEVSRG